MASEFYVLSLGFNIAIIIKFILNQIFSVRSQRKIFFFIYIDSKSLYEYLIKLKITQKKRLIINILYLKQSYERREIIEILWIKKNKNATDFITKNKSCDVLQRLVDTNHLDLDLEK